MSIGILSLLEQMICSPFSVEVVVHNRLVCEVSILPMVSAEAGVGRLVSGQESLESMLVRTDDSVGFLVSPTSLSVKSNVIDKVITQPLVDQSTLLCSLVIKSAEVKSEVESNTEVESMVKGEGSAGILVVGTPTIVSKANVKDVDVYED